MTKNKPKPCPKSPKITRKPYTAAEVAAIDACFEAKGNLRKLACDLGRSYLPVWRFASQRGGGSKRAERAREKQQLAAKIKRKYEDLFANRRRRSVTATEVARAAGTSRFKVKEVLGETLERRKTRSGKLQCAFSVYVTIGC